MSRLAGVALIAVALGGCAVESPTLEPEAVAVESTDRDAEFTLTIRSPRAVWREGEAIEAEAALAYIGPQAQAILWGSSAGVLAFKLDDVDGPLDTQGGWDTDCGRHAIGRAAPVVVPYRKAGGFSGDDPNADFWRAYFDDPIFRLPAGPWRLTALASFSTGGEPCFGIEHDLEAAIDILVVR